jgi:uncharacterized protein (TIGR02246 family)
MTWQRWLNSSPKMRIGSTSSAGWPGKTSVVTGNEAIHRTFFRRTEIEIGHIDVRLIGPDIAVCIVHLKVEPFTPPDGVARPASENRLSLVLARQDGHWRIANGHNTVIDPAAKPFNPVKMA